MSLLDVKNSIALKIMGLEYEWPKVYAYFGIQELKRF